MRRTMGFVQDDRLQLPVLRQRRRVAGRAAETFASVVDTGECIERGKFAPINRLADAQEPRLRGERVYRRGRPPSAPADADTLAPLRGRPAAMRCFYACKLPKIDARLLPVAARQPLRREMRADWF